LRIDFIGVPSDKPSSFFAEEASDTKAGDLRFDISLIAIEIGLCPGFRFTTATFNHWEPRSMLETADWDRGNTTESTDKTSTSLNKLDAILDYTGL